jgi:hypothetical protein
MIYLSYYCNNFEGDGNDMATVLFIDDRLGEVRQLWAESGCANSHGLLPLEPFDSIEQTVQVVESLKPDIIIVGYGLGKPNVTGANVIQSLRDLGYAGCIIANSGGGMAQFTRAGVAVDASANRSPDRLRKILTELTEPKGTGEKE